MRPEAFTGAVWRVASRERDPLRGSTAEGRWSAAGELEVLHTSLEPAGALAEIGYRLSIEPIWPSKVQHELHRIRAKTARSLRFPDVAALVPLGVNADRYASFDYGATQAIAAAARFLEFDSLIVPSARSPALHLVIFLDAVVVEDALRVLDSEPVDWERWRRSQRK